MKIPIKLPNEAVIYVDATPEGGKAETDVAAEADAAAPGVAALRSWEEITPAIEGLAQWIGETLKMIRPTKAGAEFGVEFGVEAGQIRAFT
jgi:hypothetical protein